MQTSDAEPSAKRLKAASDVGTQAMLIVLRVHYGLKVGSDGKLKRLRTEVRRPVELYRKHCMIAEEARHDYSQFRSTLMHICVSALAQTTITEVLQALRLMNIVIGDIKKELKVLARDRRIIANDFRCATIYHAIFPSTRRTMSAHVYFPANLAEYSRATKFRRTHLATLNNECNYLRDLTDAWAEISEYEDMEAAQYVEFIKEWRSREGVKELEAKLCCGNIDEQ